MELYPAEVTSLRKMVEEWVVHDNRELEASFKNAGYATAFLAVAKRLQSKGLTALPQEDRLNIVTPEHLRFTLTGMGTIEAYCRDNVLEGKPYEVMVKDRAGVESNLDLDEYDTRVKVRREIPLTAEDATVQEMLKNWDSQRKAFRLIRRWTYLDEKGGIRYDLSMVRSTTTDDRGRPQWQNTFAQVSINRRPIQYEVEVELLRPEEVGKDPEAIKAVTDAAVKNLIRGIGEVLRGIQKNSFLIRKTVAFKALEGYKALTKTDRFRGVAPVPLKRVHMKKIKEDKTPNIRDGYNVTDKADGLRMMGYVDSRGELFMIDMSFTVYRTGLVRKGCSQSLVDGEFVTQDKDGNAIQQFLLFDIYIAPEGVDVSVKPFAGEGGRHKALQEWGTRWNEGDGPTTIPGAGVSEKNKILVAVKNFIFANKGDASIFVACARVLDAAKLYHTDGLILTPNEEPIPNQPGIGWKSQFKWKPSDENTVDFLVQIEKDVDTKKDKINTGVRPGTGESIQYKTLRLYVGSSLDPAFQDPRGTVLFEQKLPGAGGPQRGKRREYKPVLFNPKELPDTMANQSLMEIHTTVDGEDVIQCENEDPIDDNTIVEMRYDVNSEAGYRWIPIRVRWDKTERFQKGIVGRTLNSEETAEDTWDSIHDPITLHMIRTGSDQPSPTELASIGRVGAGVGADTVSKVYYDRSGPKKDLMMIRGLRDFHRVYVKEGILLRAGLAGGGKSMVDLACGQGGDLWSWVRYQADFVYGTDIAGEGIRDPEGGAYRRYLNAVMKYGGYDKVAKMIFTIGSSAKVLATGEAGATPEEANIMRTVYGHLAADGPVPRFVEKYGNGVLRNGANCVAIMFAIHYFFETEATLANIVRNISDSLAIGGLFIGCCFDGQRVFDELRKIPTGGSLVGQEKGQEIWKITKRYSAEDLTTGPESLGLGIDVEFISIGTEQREYLVPFELLKAKMAEIGCDLLTSNECKELGLNASTETFDQTHHWATKKGEKFPMSPAVRQYSFFNRWFIFKRRRGGMLAEVVEEAATAAALGSVDMAVSAAAAPVGNATVNKRKNTLAEQAVAARNNALAAAAAAVPATQKPGEAQAAPLPTIPVAAPGQKKKYSLAELFQFYVDASQVDKLKIGDNDAARWLSPISPFPIKDPQTNVEYPSLEHYLAAMKYKMATNKPELAEGIFSQTGTIHQEAIRQEAAETGQGTRALTAERANELLKTERKKVLEESDPGTKGMKKYKATFDAGKWLSVKDEVLEEGLRQRWTKDARFRRIVEAAKAKGLILLYYTGTGSGSDLGGKRLADGTIDGDNKVGKIIMKLAGYR
jgi:predicted NAD-dependent protein-ADP-ribosyltransferase YbiA (DUF1768 family)